ncbi:MAG TPA: HPF/RaiA family ribosome-associated protein [Candidatus Obscuribacterales bacterium]
MKLPLQISFKNIARSKSVTNIVKEKAEKFDKLCPETISCRVTITMPHKHHHQGNFFKINIEVGLPGKKVAVSREAQNEIENKDFYHALREAFDAAYRQVEDYHKMRHAA